jgi:hypothetical protein
MRRLRQGGGSTLSTPVSVTSTCPADGLPTSPSPLQVIVAALERTLGSDARTDRALRLLRPVLFAGVLAVLGVAFICVAASTTGTWWGLVSGLSLTVTSGGIAIVRLAIVRRRQSTAPSSAPGRQCPKDR